MSRKEEKESVFFHCREREQIYCLLSFFRKKEQTDTIDNLLVIF
jgi:hypothetical protein